MLNKLLTLLVAGLILVIVYFILQMLITGKILVIAGIILAVVFLIIAIRIFGVNI